ncbi:MAG: serine acetyltransferase [Nitrospira bacterium SG8_35_4]|nr:MAG: serine acetyltransferase [Nitrospira bacterium SG8_35_4]
MFDNIKSDISRFSAGRVTVRIFLRCLLSQGFQAILVYRFFHWLRSKNVPAQPFRFIVERFIEITTGISIPAECKIGKGFRIHHFGGIIFHPTVRLGDNCTVYHEVTIGDRGGYGGAAKIGNNVLIGAGAKIIGEITIGDNCIIGANTVLTKDLPFNYLAVGNPCQLRPRSLENDE